jgi:hypothetical protein
MATNEKMMLGDWIGSCGLRSQEMAEKAGVSPHFVTMACAGVKGPPMAKAGIQKILDILSEAHGFPVTPDMVQDLKVMGG